MVTVCAAANRFCDVGARFSGVLVWTAPDFIVKKHPEKLLALQDPIERDSWFVTSAQIPIEAVKAG